MDNKKSAIKGKSSLAVTKATKPMRKVKRDTVVEDDLEKPNKNVVEKEQSDTKEIIERLADRIQKIEEKMDLLITLISPNNEIATAGKTVKAETESNSADDVEPSKKKVKLDAETPSSHGLYVGGRLAGGRCGGRGRCGKC